MSSSEQLRFDPKNMIFRQLGGTGLRVSVFSLGSWLTLGGTVKGDPVKEIVRTAYEAGVNFFDSAEVYSGGQAEKELGRVIKELNIAREEIVVTTKIFFGTGSKEPNGRGLSRKHIIEGTKASLARLDMHYVDVIFAHRPDTSVPMEETVRAFSWVIDHGYAFYWGGSEWTAQQYEEAIGIADRLGLHRPHFDQPQYNLFHREKVEKEFVPLQKKYGFGTTIWSPLANGILTNKYADGIPEDSRFKKNADFFKDTIQSLEKGEGKVKIDKTKKLDELAKKHGGNATQLALAWCAKNENVSTVILGASKPEQLEDCLKALDFLPKLTPEVMEEIEKIVDSKPEAVNTFGR